MRVRCLWIGSCVTLNFCRMSQRLNARGNKAMLATRYVCRDTIALDARQQHILTRWLTSLNSFFIACELRQAVREARCDGAVSVSGAFWLECSYR